MNTAAVITIHGDLQCYFSISVTAGIVGIFAMSGMWDLPWSGPALLAATKVTWRPVQACSLVRNDFTCLWNIIAMLLGLLWFQLSFCASHPATKTWMLGFTAELFGTLWSSWSRASVVSRLLYKCYCVWQDSSEIEPTVTKKKPLRTEEIILSPLGYLCKVKYAGF